MIRFIHPAPAGMEPQITIRFSNPVKSVTRFPKMMRVISYADLRIVEIGCTEFRFVKFGYFLTRSISR